MIQIIHQPNDKLFKESMTSLSVAKEFFASHLPAEILKKVDLSTLKLEKETFITISFRKKEADLIYSLIINGNRGYFYLLCEHQGKIDAMMAFRLWQYILLLIEAHLKQHPGSVLPIVYPIVVYTGERKWNAALEIFDLFGENKELARQIFTSPYQLIEIHKISDGDLKKNLLIGLVEFVLKHQKRRANEEFMKNLFQWIRNIEMIHRNNESAFLEKVLMYVVYSIDHDDIESFTRYSKEYLSEPLGENTMTLKQAFEQRAREETIKEMQPLIFFAEEKAKKAEEKAKQTEEKAKQTEEKAKQTKHEIACAMFKKGLNIDMISEVTQLPLQQLELLKLELAE